MQIIPAIDIKNANVVRLLRGDPKDVTVYSEDPQGMAKKWFAMGAEWLHIVDLDRALKSGRNTDIIKEICRLCLGSIETGGGIRTLGDIDELLASGAKRVIIGTKAATDEKFLKEASQKFKDKLMVSVDSRQGRVAVEGWKETSGLSTDEFMKTLEGRGIKWVLYTDIAKDGSLEGPDIDQIKKTIKGLSINIVVSGGVGDIEDTRRINELGVWGVVVGKALYEGRLELKEALSIANEK